MQIRMQQKNTSGYSSGVCSDNNGLGTTVVTVGQIDAPQPPFNHNGSNQSYESSIKTNGGVATGDEDSNYMPTGTGSG